MIYYVDIDNTICRTEGNDYRDAVPIPERIEKINRLFDRGDVVIYWSARGAGSGINWLMFTISQLVGWGCRFNSVSMHKPGFDFIIDDRAMKIDEL